MYTILKCVLLFCTVMLWFTDEIDGKTNKNRQVVYWNSFTNPSLITGEYTREVHIGEFMDILCPHKGLVGLAADSRSLQFNLYNVTENLYGNCQRGGHQNLMFSCDQPEKEKKLTIKFQVVSPSPLGFKFQYCKSYYLLALPISNQSHQAGCSQDSTRMKINISCKRIPRWKSKNEQRLVKEFSPPWKSNSKNNSKTTRRKQDKNYFPQQQSIMSGSKSLRQKFSILHMALLIFLMMASNG